VTYRSGDAQDVCLGAPACRTCVSRRTATPTGESSAARGKDHAEIGTGLHATAVRNSAIPGRELADVRRAHSSCRVAQSLPFRSTCPRRSRQPLRRHVRSVGGRSSRRLTARGSLRGTAAATVAMNGPRASETDDQAFWQRARFLCTARRITNDSDPGDALVE
jgi:hypothetical protein